MLKRAFLLAYLSSFYLAINKIEQKGDWTVVASACTGGLPDTVGGESFLHMYYMI